MIPLTALEAEARVLAFGSIKYEKHNWKKGFAWSRLYDAALRHIYASVNGENLDSESGLNHLAHARCCLGFLIEHMEKDLGEDDR